MSEVNIEVLLGQVHFGVSYSFVVTSNYARIELWIIGKSREENKEIFDDILYKKDEIESSFGNQLDWQRRDDGKGSRIAYWLEDVNVFNEDDWPKMIAFSTSNMVKSGSSIKGVLRDVIKK